MAKIHIGHKTYISAWKHAQLIIRGYRVKIQPTSSPLHYDIEHIDKIPGIKRACVCACMRACDIYFKLYFSSYALYKIREVLC